MGGIKKTTMCSNRNARRNRTSNVKSVVGMYIRGEKRIEEIVHPSKISRKLVDATRPASDATRLSSCTLRQNATICNALLDPTKAICFGHLQSKEDGRCWTNATNVACADSAPELGNVDSSDLAVTVAPCPTSEPIKIASVNRIRFKGEDMMIKLRADEGKQTEPKLKSAGVECSIHPSVRERELDLIIEPLNDHIVSEMVLENKNLKLLLKPAERDRRGSEKSAASSRVDKIESKFGTVDAGRLQVSVGGATACECGTWERKSILRETSADSLLANENSDAETQSWEKKPRNSEETDGTYDSQSDDVFIDESESRDAGLILTLPENELKPLKTDIYYYKEKIDHEQEQINNLTAEILKAERLFRERENEMDEGSRDVSKSFSRVELDELLREFSETSETRSGSSTSDVGLNILITDYFSKYYDNLSKKIDQFNRERTALLVVIDDLHEEENKLRCYIKCLRHKLAENSKNRIQNCSC